MDYSLLEEIQFWFAGEPDVVSAEITGEAPVELRLEFSTPAACAQAADTLNALASLMNGAIEIEWKPTRQVIYVGSG